MPYSLLEAKPIEELCKVVDCEHKTAPYVDESDYLVVRTSNVRDGQLVMESMKYTTLEGYNEWTSRAVPEYGDVLFTREAPAGESCLVPSDTKVCMGQRMVMLRPHKSEVDPVFLSMILNTERTKNDIYRLSIGSTVSRINIADIRKLKVASPPLPEQQKIAKILSTWDRAISTTERLIENSTEQKKALMQQLLTGKKRLLDESGKRFEGEWEEVTLGECINHTGGTALEKHVKDGASHHFISIGNYSVDGRYIDKSQRVEFNDKTKTKLLNKNDLVMVLNDKTKTGDIIGSTILIDENNKYIYNQRSERIVCSEGTDVLFFWFLLNSTPVRADVFGRSQGGTQIYVNFGALKSIVLYLPPFEEQQKIATVLTNADKEIELLEQQLVDLQQEKKALMQVLLTGKKRVVVDGEVA